MKKAMALLLCGCFLLTACSCGPKEETTEFTAMDTLISIRVSRSNGGRTEDVLKAFTHRVKELETLFDANCQDSDVFAINGKDTGVRVSKDTAAILEKSIYANTLTEGAFDITVMPLLKLWGFDSGNYCVPKKEDIKNALENMNSDGISVEGTTVTKSAKTQISLGGIAKGYAGDELLKIAEENGVSGVISLGGNIVLCGENTQKGSWTVGVKNPVDTDSLVCTFNHKGNVSVVTSGGYERSFTKDGKTYHHIIDTKTGEPAETDLLSVTVIGGDGALCDAFSTALFVMGKEKAVKFAEEHNDFEYIFITDKKEIIKTGGVSGFEILSEDFILTDK